MIQSIFYTISNFGFNFDSIKEKFASLFGDDSSFFKELTSTISGLLSSIFG